MVGIDNGLYRDLYLMIILLAKANKLCFFIPGLKAGAIDDNFSGWRRERHPAAILFPMEIKIRPIPVCV